MTERFARHIYTIPAKVQDGNVANSIDAMET